MAAVAYATEFLDQVEWRRRQDEHQARGNAWIEPHRQRSSRGEKHPVYDFLFTYYAFRPAWLRRWHPGPMVGLAGEAAREFLRWPEYRETPDGVAVDVTTLPAHRREFVTWLRGMLAAMQTRP